MEKEKKKNWIIILLAIICLILIALVVLFATDTINLNKNLTEDNSNQNKNDSNTSSEKIEENKSDEIITDNDVKENNPTKEQDTNNSSIQKATTNMSREEVFDLWNKINKKDSLVSRIRIKGTNDESNNIILDSDMMSRKEYITVDLNQETGEVNSVQLLSEMRKIAMAF